MPAPSTLATWQTVLGANPAANAEFSVTVPAGYWYGLLGVSVSLVQGATQQPQPILRIADPGTNVLYESFGSSGTQAVSTTCQYSWVVNGPQPAAIVGTTTNCHAIAPLPDDLVLPEGYVISSNTLGIGANSNYGAPVLFVVIYGGGTGA